MVNPRLNNPRGGSDYDRLLQFGNGCLVRSDLNRPVKPRFRFVLVLLGLLVGGHSLSAETVAEEMVAEEMAVQEDPATPEHLDLAAAFASFAEAAKWVEAWETPEEMALPKQCVGVWVGLRWTGRLMGEYSDGRPALAPTNSDRVLTGAVRKVLYRALERARGGDGDAVTRAERVERFREIPCTLEIQFAHDLKRLRGVDSTGISAQVRPGIDGILLRIKGKARALFPGSMLANEQLPAGALQALRFDLELTEKEFDAQLADGRIRVWKFSVFHLAQPGPNLPPTILQRGSRLVTADSITQHELENFADGLAKHLQQRLWPGPEPLGIMGTYLADVDRYEPLTATGADQILAALALARYATWREAAAPQQAAQSRNAAQRIINDLIARSDVNLNPIQVAGIAAVFVLAVDELGAAVEFAPEIWNARTQCVNLIESTFIPEQQQFHDSVAPSEQAVCALVLGTREAVASVWQNTPPHLQPSLLPWQGWAELQLAPAGQPIGAAAGLKSLRQRLWATQAHTPDQEPDLAGGLSFRGNQPPDWNTARPLAFLATMLGDPRLTNTQNLVALNQEIVNVTNGMRFLRQLSMREVDRYRLANPPRALPGVRSALWSDREPVSASAMTLISITEFCKSLDAIKEQLRTKNDPR